MGRDDWERLIEERAIGEESRSATSKRARPARTVTVNAAESPLGWLCRAGT